MGLPSQKRTRRSKKERASHFALKKINLAKCPECSSPILPHHSCPKCGKYRGHQAVDQKKRVERRSRRKIK